MAKKRKGARPAASRGTRKKAASRGTRKKAAPRARAAAAAPATFPGRENPKRIVLTPLKAQIRANIARLEKVTEPNMEVEQALRALRVAQEALLSGCGPTMVISIP